MPGEVTALEQLAADDRFDVRTFAAARRGDRWIAHVRCGMKSGASPVWRGEGATRDEAIEAAARMAVGYWHSTAIAGQVRQRP